MDDIIRVHYTRKTPAVWYTAASVVEGTTLYIADDSLGLFLSKEAALGLAEAIVTGLAGVAESQHNQRLWQAIQRVQATLSQPVAAE